MEIEGKIILDLPLQSGTSQKTGNTWQKKEYVLETAGSYPKKICFSLFGERVQTLRFELGKWYAVQVDIESREYNQRWYTDIRAFGAREIADPTMGGGMGAQGNPFGAAPAAPFGAPQGAPFGAPQAAPQPSSFPGAAADFAAPAGSQDDLPF